MSQETEERFLPAAAEVLVCGLSAAQVANRLDRPRPKGNYGMAAFYRSIDTCVLGRKTYDLAISFGMAEGYAGKKNYVFSRNLSKAASPKVSVINEHVSVFAERLRSGKGKHIWLVGGAGLLPRFSTPGRWMSSSSM